MDKFKYLGTIFSQSGSFLNVRKHVTAQAKKAMYLLNRIRKFDLPIDLQLKLFDNTILPILTHSYEVFGFEDCHMLEAIHNQFLRSLTYSRKSTPLYILKQKKKRPIFMVLYLSIQLRCCNKNQTKVLIKRPTRKKW